MLSELLQAARFLEAGQVVLADRPPGVRAHAKAPAIVAYYAEDGQVNRFALAEKPPGQVKFQPNNHAAFPALTSRAVALGGDKPETRDAQREELARRLGDVRAFEKAFAKAAVTFGRAAEALPEGSALRQAALSAARLDAKAWARAAAETLPDAARALPDEALDRFAAAVFGGTGLQLVVVPETDPGLTLNARRFEAAVRGAATERQPQAGDGADAFGGTGAPSKMAAPSLPAIHPMPVPLVSRAADFRALDRYGKPAFGVRTSTARRLQGALDYLLNPERRGLTWQAAKSPEGQPRLLVAVGDPAKSQLLLDLLARHEGLETAVYERAAARLLEGDAETPVELLVLESPLRMGVRVDARRPYSARTWAGLFEGWQRDLEPLAPGRIRKLLVPLTPARASELLAQRWGTSQGRPAKQTVMPRVRLAAEQWFEVGPDAAPRLAEALVEALPAPTLRLLTPAQPFKPSEFRYQADGIARLLTFAGRRAGWKLTTMHPSYQLGQALALADVIHASWHLDRSGKLPNGGLAGTDALGQAELQPADAYVQMSRRLQPAYQWANRLRYLPGEKSKPQRAALGALKRFRALFPDAAGGLPPFPEGVEHQALLRLGYQADPFGGPADAETPGDAETAPGPEAPANPPHPTT